MTRALIPLLLVLALVMTNAVAAGLTARASGEITLEPASPCPPPSPLSPPSWPGMASRGSRRSATFRRAITRAAIPAADCPPLRLAGERSDALVNQCRGVVSPLLRSPAHLTKQGQDPPDG